jgi:single-stranded-DNA-specific exonuclease
MTEISYLKRPFDIRINAIASELTAQGVTPLLAKIGAFRGLRHASEFDLNLARMLAPQGMLNTDIAAQALLEAIATKQKLLIVADYDCDGATGCAVLIRGLRMMGADVDYIVPNRFTHGYGLSPALVEEAVAHPRLGRPDWIITVDNGIASVEGVARANELGIRVLVTDHHLPGPTLPAAAIIVNPNQVGCPFPSKSIAGVGVALYVLLATRALRRKRHPELADIPLQNLLDFVALGTVADVVTLDHNNRILVQAGLERMRGGKGHPGIKALFEVAKKDWRQATSADLGFSIGPRINAAGRLQDIGLGIECLLCDDTNTADRFAQQLGAVNEERREIQLTMQAQADAALGTLSRDHSLQKIIVAFDERWHEGLVGLVAGRLKEAHYKPCFAFAPSAADPQWLKGSGRSINGVHLRDFLDQMTKTAPGLTTEMLPRFGGHAMAAGLTLHKDYLERFIQIAQAVASQAIAPHLLQPIRIVDLALAAEQIDTQVIETLESQPWGAGFVEPLFQGEFDVVSQKMILQKHSKLKLTPFPANLKSKPINAIFFGYTETMSGRVNIAYRLARDTYQGPQEVQLMIEAII